MDHKHNESIWKNSFWAFKNVLMNCITIDSPIESLRKPMYAQVCMYISRVFYSKTHHLAEFL